MTGPVGMPHEKGLLLALLRVRAGHVSVYRAEVFADQGRPFPPILVPHLRELFDHGQARIIDNDSDAEVRRVVITPAGEALLAELDNPPRDPSTSDEPG